MINYALLACFLRFSTDEGKKWRSYQFYDKELHIYGLLTEPGEHTTVFTLFGAPKDKKHEWILIKIDLKSAFSKRLIVVNISTSIGIFRLHLIDNNCLRL